jgi:hypothetical protein
MDCKPIEMDVATVFKRKVGELLKKLQDRFPGRLMFASVALTQADEHFMFREYVEKVHHLYGGRIKARDEQFFMTTDDIDDPMNITALLRGLWVDMTSKDQEVVWRYLDVFEKLACKSTIAA